MLNILKSALVVNVILIFYLVQIECIPVIPDTFEKKGEPQENHLNETIQHDPVILFSATTKP